MTKKITFCGICCALSVVVLLLTEFLPFNTVFLICAATAFFPLVKIKFGTKWAFCAVAAGIGVGFVVLANKVFWLSYAMLSVYAVIKGIIERINNVLAETMLKLLLCIIGMCIIFNIISATYNIYMYVIGIAGFFIYDYVLSIFISYIGKKMRFFQ